MLNSFDGYLYSQFSDDYWSDEGIGHAAKLLKEFSESDWAALYSSIHDRQELWLVRCAETIGEFPSNMSLQILLLLLQTDSEEVVVAALDSIGSVVSNGFSVGSSRSQILSAVEKMKPHQNRVAQLMLDTLISKLA